MPGVQLNARRQVTRRLMHPPIHSPMRRPGAVHLSHALKVRRLHDRCYPLLIRSSSYGQRAHLPASLLLRIDGATAVRVVSVVQRRSPLPHGFEPDPDAGDEHQRDAEPEPYAQGDSYDRGVGSVGCGFVEDSWDDGGSRGCCCCYVWSHGCEQCAGRGAACAAYTAYAAYAAWCGGGAAAGSGVLKSC